MKSNLLTGLAAAVVALSASPGTAHADDRYAVVQITNNTNSHMSLYRKWVWNFGAPQERTQLDWRVTKIPPGETMTLHHSYQGAAESSPDLIVVFDSDRNNGAHWEMVKLARKGSPDFRDRRSGFHYSLEYDNNRREFGSLRPKNGGRVEILDRKAARPSGAQEIPFN